MPAADDLTRAERERIAPYVTDTTGPVFALTNLPEVVKGALFARYSRSPKSLRRLLLDEFLPPGDTAVGEATDTGTGRAEALYDRVLAEYGDDSVAQLGGAHLAVEGASNVLTKVLEWGRLGSYLEQSTRYIQLDDRPGGRYRYHRPASVLADPELDRMLLAQRREMDPARRREIVFEIQRYLADKAYYIWLPMWPRYIAYPSYVKGFKQVDGYSLGSRLMHVWFER